jgi:hypothetical protein
MNKNSLLKLIFFMTVFSFLLINFSPVVQSVPSIYQEIVIVDPTGGGDYTTIKDAVENANSLSIIQIRPGTYKEKNIHITNKIALVGTGSDNTILDLDENPGFTIGSSYVEIHDLKIINSKKYAVFVSPEVGYFNISNCVIEVSSSNGIAVRGFKSTISDCYISSNTEDSQQGIKLEGDDNVVEGSTVRGFGEGILVLLYVHNNQILNCNTFGNDVGIDIRIGSKNNIVSNCNIYGNKYGVYIWQNSNDNSIYLNNFWKNDENAIDENNNDWDNGVKGNYWEDYTGSDTDSDGIGDTPYVISSGKEDSYPVMTRILPSKISTPTNLELTSPNWVDTPTFSWDPSVYSKGVAGYYVKIDTGSEIYIGDTTTWTSTSSVSDGLHIFYVKAKGDDDTLSSYASLSFTIDSTFIDNDRDGWSDEEELEYGTNPNNPNSLPPDTDNDHIPDSIDTDDDGDEIPDSIENILGSDPQDDSDVIKIYIAGSPYYLIDTDKDGEYNILYELTSEKTTTVEKQGNNYLLDKNADGSWDYVYDVESGAVTAYKEQATESIFVWMITVAIIFIFLFVLLYLIKIRPMQDRTKVSAKKFARKKFYERPVTFDKDPLTRIDQTRQLLENIQQDVAVQIEQLNQMEAKIKPPIVKTEEIRTPALEEIRGPVISEDKKLDVYPFEKDEEPVEEEFVRDEDVEAVPVERVVEVEEEVEPEVLEGEGLVEEEFVRDEDVEAVPVERVVEVEEEVEPETYEDKKDHNELRNKIDKFLSNRRKKQRNEEEK